MKKMLMVASVPSMIGQFNMSNINILQSMGYEVHVACNFKDTSVWNKERKNDFINQLKKLDIRKHQIDFARDIKKLNKHLKAYQQLKRIISKGNYEFIHCHTPMGGVIGRLVAQKTKTKVIYTAHGFHFFEGASILNWLLYYPIEYFLSRYTDILITINKGDYQVAKKSFKAKKIAYISGVGIDIPKFSKIEVDKMSKRIKLGLPQNAFVILSVGELNRNKNHETIIKAIRKLNDHRVHYVICGHGKLENYLKNIITNLKLKNQIHLLGFRKDIKDIYAISDIFVFPSKREGLGMAALEAMASGLPLITSYIHGIKDYTEDERTGYCIQPMDIDGFANAIKNMIANVEFREKCSISNLKIVKKFDIENVKHQMEGIYNVYK